MAAVPRNRRPAGPGQVGARFKLTGATTRRHLPSVLGRPVVRRVDRPADVEGLEAQLAAEALAQCAPGVAVLLTLERGALQGLGILVVSDRRPDVRAL